MTLPDFLVIGAGRSGTTSLHHYLRQHPDVFVPEAKEPSFFAFMDGGPPLAGPGAEWFRRVAVRTRADYEALFAGARTRVIGEVSPIYLVVPGVPDRIHAMIPDVRLVAILRHPVERAHAAYLGLRRDGQEPAPTFEQALDEEDSRLERGWPFAGLARNGLYHRLLTSFYQQFPRERIRVYLYDDLARDPLALMRDLFGFIGVDPAFVPDVSRRHGGVGMVRNPVIRALWRHSQVPRRLVRGFLPQRWRDRAFEWVTRDQVRPVIAPATRAMLLDRYRPDLLALQDLIGRDLSAWLR